MTGVEMNAQAGAREVEELRGSLDELDSAIVQLLADRLALVGDIADSKERRAADVRDAERERHVLSKVSREAVELGISPDFVRRLFEEIIEHSVALQTSRIAAR
jgi:chorismate mutase